MKKNSRPQRLEADSSGKIERDAAAAAEGAAGAEFGLGVVHRVAGTASCSTEEFSTSAAAGAMRPVAPEQFFSKVVG